ncbi:MAG: hypothetical protein M0036_14030 [Desulfobacteraceae bacterium]|nr:hypothetical protein [Desulfobacteraceae bacterium]
MLKLSTHIFILILVAAIAIPPVCVMAETTMTEGKDPQVNAAYIAGDALIARPLGLVATVVGFGFFIIASPFALITHSAEDAWNGLVMYPVGFTFKRPIGDFN